MAAPKNVVIQHTDGRRYGVKATDKRVSQPGWKIVAEADNTTPYTAPKARTEKPASDAKDDGKDAG